MTQMLKCQNCGANLTYRADHCGYCGASVRITNDPNNELSGTGKLKLFDLPAGVAEFGISTGIWLILGILTLVSLYILGWLYEDTRYWLATKAMVIWTGMLPAGLLVFAALLNLKRGQMGLGVLVFILVSLIHLVVMVLIRGNINDDMVGISILIGATSFTAWLVGRFLHLWIRYLRQ